MKRVFHRIKKKFSLSKTWTKIVASISLLASLSSILAVLTVPEIRCFVELPEECVGTQKDEETWLTYTAPNNLFTIRYPPNWSLEEINDPLDGTVLKLIPLGKGGNRLNITVSISIQDLQEEPLSLEAHEDNVVRSVQQFATNPQIVSRQETIFANRSAYQLVYRRSEDRTSFKVLYTVALDRYQAYTFIYQAPISLYKFHEQDVLRVKQSFTVQ